MPRVNLDFVPLRAALCEDRDNTVDVLVRAQAPATPDERHTRMPLNLALVIDRSGSMSGQPLHEAKRCAAMIVDSLAASDRASLVVYDNTIDVLVPAQPVVDRITFRSAIDAIESGGSTALYGGWVSGAEQSAMSCSDGTLSRVLLLSDGMANVGPRSTAQIAPRCAEMAAAGVSTSTYGLGRNFNEELMAAMASEGQGNAYYGRTAEDLEDPFRQEFDLMTALCARALRLAIMPAPGVRAEIVNRYPTDADGRSMLPDLAYGSEAWALIRLTVPRSIVHSTDDVHVLSATLEYSNLGGERTLAGPIHLRLPRLPTGAFATVAPNDTVARRVSELQAASMQEDARRAARDGDWGTVARLLNELRAEAVQHPWIAASVKQLELYARRRETQRFSKEALYKANNLRSRLSSPEESQDWSLDEEAKRASFLRRKREQGRRFRSEESDRRS